MEKLTILLFNSIIINFCDYIIIYSICNNLIRKSFQISIKIIFIGIIYGITFGISSRVLDAYTFKIIITFITLLIIKLISKKRIHDLLIVYVIIYLSVTFIQIPTLLFVENLGLHRSYTFLLTQISTLILIIFLCIKIPLYKLLYIIEKEILLKMFVFILTGMYILSLFYLNFDYDNVRPYIIYFTIFTFITLIGLYRTLKRLIFYTNKVPMQLHDVKNMLMGVRLTAYSTSNINEIRDGIDQCLDVINFNDDLEKIYVDEYERNILSFIRDKVSKNKDLLFDYDIQYYENNIKVTFPIIIYMLGVLIDNAIESDSKKVIYIKTLISEDKLMISVSNEYNKKSKDDFVKMFQKGESSKSKFGRGYGLYNLNKLVTKYDGEIILKHEPNQEQKNEYLTIIIFITL